MPGVLFDNFFCVACLIFALTVFKGNDILYILCIWKTKTFLQFAKLLCFKFGVRQLRCSFLGLQRQFLK